MRERCSRWAGTAFTEGGLTCFLDVSNITIDPASTNHEAVCESFDNADKDVGTPTRRVIAQRSPRNVTTSRTLFEIFFGQAGMQRKSTGSIALPNFSSIQSAM